MSQGRPNAVYIEGGFAELAFPGGARVTTTRLSVGHYVRIDDGRQYPQLCVGGERRGNTVDYQSPDQLARDLGARLYRTRAGFERAAARLALADKET